MSKSSPVRFHLFIDWNVRAVFFPFLFSNYCCSIDAGVVCVVFGRCDQSFFALFYVESILRFYLQCFRVLFVFHFLIHIVCLCHLWDERSYASSLVFQFSCPLVEVLPSSTSRMVPSILQGGQPKCLSLLWNLCCRPWFREAFLIFPFISACLMVSTSNTPKYFSFSFSLIWPRISYKGDILLLSLLLLTDGKRLPECYIYSQKLVFQI